LLIGRTIGLASSKRKLVILIILAVVAVVVFPVTLFLTGWVFSYALEYGEYSLVIFWLGGLVITIGCIIGIAKLKN